MKKMIFALAIISLICAFHACDEEPVDPDALSPGDFLLSMQFEGLERLYTVHVPASYTGTTAVPLVLDFHGYMSSGDSQADTSGFKEKSDEAGFIVVFPEGVDSVLGQSWNAGETCCGAASNDNLNDVGFAIAIVDDISTRAFIDLKRVYATGHSNGGGLTHRLGIDASHVFAAIAPTSMGIVPPNGQDSLLFINPSRSVPVIYFHGINDLTVPYDSDTMALPTLDSYKLWAQANGCSGAWLFPLNSQVIREWSDGSIYEAYTECDDGVQVALVTLDCYHNDLRGFTPDGGDESVADIAWDFLSRYSLP